MKPVLLGAALLMLAIVSASAAPFSALYAFDDSLSDAATLLSPPAMPSARSTQCLCQRLRGVQQWAGLGAGFGKQSWAWPVAAEPRRRNRLRRGGAQTGAFGAYNGAPGDLLPAPGNPLSTSQLGMFTATVPHPAANALYTLSIGSNDLETIFPQDAGNPAQANADATSVIGNIATFIGDLGAGGARTFARTDLSLRGAFPCS